MRLTVKEAAQLVEVAPVTLWKHIERQSGYGPLFTKGDDGRYSAERKPLLAKKLELDSRKERNEVIKVYLSGDERDQLRAQAGDKAISSFCRWLIMRGVE